MRRALPYCRSMRSRKPRSVLLSYSVARQHLIGQRQAFRRHHQRDDHLHAIWPMVARVAVPALVTLREWRSCLEVGAGQIIKQYVEAGVEQIAPAPHQVIEHRLLVLQQPVVAAIQLVALRQPRILTQKIGKRAALEPFPVQPPLASRRQQPVGHQHEQHLIPPCALAARPQTFGPEPVKPKLPPQHQSQPARPPLTRPTQPHLRQPHPDNRGVRHKLFTAILGKQRERAGSGRSSLYDLDRPTPR